MNTVRGGEKGLTVAEVVVALTIIGLIVASITTLVSRTVENLAVAAGRDGAEQLAATTLEQAKALGCGLVRGDEAPAAMTRWRDRCWGGLGDSTYTQVIGVTTYTAVLHTAWRQLDAGPDRCTDALAAKRRGKPLVAQADGLERDVTVRWVARGRTNAVTATDYESVPPDAVAYRDTARGGVLLEGARGEPVSISLPGASVVARVVDSSGCVFFPFLPAGPLTWSVGATHGSATIAAEAIVTEPSGQVVS